MAQRPLSNVSVQSYQDYQPARKYGPQYEPGGYAASVQQRTNMTQREDALKFEQGRIKALQEERLHIQKKTFTKWMNSFLQKARMEVEDLFVDLADGRRLLKLLEIISGERLPRPNSGRMRVHKIENVNKSLSFLHTKVRLESIGAEDIVDGNPRLILGLIWTIILRFQIQEIEIDVDEENVSSEKKSAKDALLLWCQRKTSGYHGVHIHNFTDSWRSGLGFNALIHSHRPDLFRWQEVPVTDHVATLNHAFDQAESMGIPKLLDAEDVDTTRPDEKSVMTYVASYYHTFARMKNEQKSGKRIANIIGQLMDCDGRKNEYSRLISTLLEWIRMKIAELSARELPNSLDGIQRLLLAFKEYRTVEKPPKYKERSEIEALYFDINTMNKSLVGEAWSPLEGQWPSDLERAWQTLEQAEHARELALRTELLRQQRLEQLNYKFNTKSVLRKGYLKEMIQVLSDPRYGSNLAQVDATVKKHEAISADILARKERFEDLSAMAAELVRENYHGAEAVSKCSEDVLARWRSLLALLEKHRAALGALAALMSLLREARATLQGLAEMKAQFHSEEVGRHLSDVERLLQAHALQELQLGALDETIRRLVRQGNAVEGPEQPKQQLAQQLTQLEDEYDSLVAAAKDRKARLEDARNLNQFLEDHEEEEGWVTDKQRICRADVAAKDLRGVQALRQKHTALLHELRARDHVSQRHRSKGQSLIDAKHPKSAEIERRLATLSELWEELRSLAAAREKQLADAAEVYQFYGDANEADSWMKEKRPLLASADTGGDAPSASALLGRHKALHEELQAYSAELQTLSANADRLTESGIHTLQLPTEVESTPAVEEEEWVNETRLVPTEVWEEEPVERLEHKTVTEERSVPQVKALYAFSGQGISMAKGEVMFLMSRTNPDWWSVRKADRTDGFVPANYLREIEPRLLPVQVRRPEKVRTVQRVKKTVLVKRVVPVRRAAPRRAHRARAPPDAPNVPKRMEGLKHNYDELLKLSAERRAQLEDAIKLYSLYAECDDLDKWIKDKDRMLRSDDGQETVDNAKRKYEKFVTDLSAASKRLEHINAQTDSLIERGHSQASVAAARRQQLQQQWDRLLRTRHQKEAHLQGASSVELFGRTCDEALDWMAEKEQQLASSSPPPADLRTVQALQRRHAQLERELEPLREKVNTVTLLANSVKSQYPNERSNVEARQHQIQEMWTRCEQQAADRRRRLESAVGHQVFGSSSRQLAAWLQKTREQLSQEVVAKDVATAEALHKQHQELRDDIRTHEDEFKEVIALGKKLVANNASLTDVADKIKYLRDEQKAVERDWRAKELHLKQCVQLAQFNREADQIDACSGAHQAYLDYNDTGSSQDSAYALLKRHEELSARLSAQDERLGPFMTMAAQLAQEHKRAKDHIEARKNQVVAKREAVRQAAAERRRALQASLAHYQFIASAEELQAWIQDKTRTAKDQSYRDLANLENKLQKHEAFERELQANEKQLRNVESVGQSLQNSDPERGPAVAAQLERLQAAWGALVAASRDKGSKLRQAHAQRAHKRSVEDAKARLADLERELKSLEAGTDLRSCKRMLNQHQTLEQELTLWEQKTAALAAAGQDLVSGGHFDAPAIQKSSATLLHQAAALKRPADERKAILATSLQLHKFAAEVAGELDWISERAPLAHSDVLPSDLHSAQTAVKKHAKLRAELAGRRPVVERVIGQASELAGQPNSDKIKELSDELKSAYAEVSDAADARAAKLDTALKAQQFLHEALEVDSWLNDKATALSSADVGRDRHRATSLLTRHKAVELELDTYAAIIGEMGSVAQSMSSSAGAWGPMLEERHAKLRDSLARLQRLAADRQRALVQSVCRHEYLAESAELEDWIQEQYSAASSEDYGQDYEHLLILRSKFEELRHRVESGAERFTQCEELAKKLLASESPYIPDIEKRQEALGESWQRLVEQIQSRASRLHAAGDIHRYHRDVAELLARVAERSNHVTERPEQRENNADRLAIEAQLQVLQEEGDRLMKLYPGGNVRQIEMQQRALAEAWAALSAAELRQQEIIQQMKQLKQFNTQVRDMLSWSSSMRASMSGEARVRDAATAQALRADHDALKAEIEARDDSFRQAIQMAEDMVQAGHPAAQEVEEKASSLLSERGRLHSTWAARQVSLDQLIDLHCFLRDQRQLLELCTTQEAALSTEISPTASVEEVDNQLKKHEAFEKLLLTQDERLSTLNTHGDKLLQQNHVESQRIADELALVNERRKKVHELSAKRRVALQRALVKAQFSRDVAEARSWLASKLHRLNSEQGHAEVTNLEDKIKKLQKHQAFRAELAANEARVSEVEALAAQLRPDKEAEVALASLQAEWRQLLEATEQRGKIKTLQKHQAFRAELAANEARVSEVEALAAQLRPDKEAEVALASLQAEWRQLLEATEQRGKIKTLQKHQAFRAELAANEARVSEVEALAAQLRPDKEAEVALASLQAEWRQLLEATEQRGKIKTLQKHQAFRAELAANEARVSEVEALAAQLRPDKEAEVALASLQAEWRQLLEATEQRGKIKTLQKHQAFRAELAANEARVSEVEALAAQLRPDKEAEVALASLQAEWRQLLEATEQRGRGLEEAQDILEFNQQLDKIEAWIRDKEMMVQAHELGRDYEHCSALLRKLDDLDSDMQVDDKHVRSICQLAGKLLQQGPTQQAATVEQRRDAFLHKWRALTGALQKYRDNLTAALEVHAFNRDLQDTEERIAKKASLFSSESRGRSLAAAHELRRRHDALASEASAVNDKMKQLAAEGARLQKAHPSRAKEIETGLAALQRSWDNLQQLAAKRSALLDDALAVHKFDDSLKELELWVGETVKRMSSEEAPETAAQAEAALQLHDERKAEIDGRQKSIAALEAAAKQLPEQDADKMARLHQLSKTLDTAWLDRKKELTHAHQLQMLKEQARDVEDWLAAQEAFLNNDDLGDNLDAVETLIRKHSELSVRLQSQLDKVASLQQLAAAMLEQSHACEPEIQRIVRDTQARAGKLEESCKNRGEMLRQSKQLRQFLSNLQDEREWIALRMQQACDHNYRDLSNLQSKIQKHAAFESELAANKGRIDDVANFGEELIEANHYASVEISEHVEDLENQWRELQDAAKLRRDRLQEAYQARVYLRGVDEFSAWLDDVEALLLSEDHGQDLESAQALLARHSRLEQAAAMKGDVAKQLLENSRQLTEDGHFMAESIAEQADNNVKRYRQLQEPMQIRRDNLEDAAVLFRWERDAEEEMRWLTEREPAATLEDRGSNLAQAQALQRKHLALEAELIAREPTITALCARAADLVRRGHFAAPALEGSSRQLQNTLRRLTEHAAARTRSLQRAIEALQLLSEISEAESWLLERRPGLVSQDVGRDAASVHSLQRRLQAHSRELANVDAQHRDLNNKAAPLLASEPTKETELVKTKLEELRVLYEEMKLLTAKREQRLEQSLKYFKFVGECSETQEWISAQVSEAASEDYGLDVEHVEALQQQADNFLTQLHANEGRIEAVCDAGAALLEDNTPEADRVRQRVEDIRGLWEDLKELALARQEALAGARQVHEFDRSADETVAWIQDKQAALASVPPPPALRALTADLEAIRAQHRELTAKADKLSAAYPDAAEHVHSKLEDVSLSLETLTELASRRQTEAELAAQLQTYFDQHQRLLAWANETLARVTAPELAADVSGAERLLTRHRDLHKEIEHKDVDFKQFYEDGEKLVRDEHFMSAEIAERVASLRARRSLLDATWTRRATLYEQHLDALVFRRDADALDNWITTRVPLVRDGKLGDSVPQVEELINRHRDLEELINAQQDRFNALRRITLVEKAFQSQKDSEEEARRQSAARAEEARREQFKRKEVERIAEERRRQHAPAQQVVREVELASQGSGQAEETISPAPQFEKLPKADPNVKRAESMQVSGRTPKRTPSFTTRRRTQSFRRHRRGDGAELPPVEIEGYLERKQEAGCGGKRATVRSWRNYYCVLCGQLLCFFRDEQDFAAAKAAAPPVAIANARCEPAGDYTKRANVFRLAGADGAEYLFACTSRELMQEWVAKLSFHAQLPPELQLTPYTATAQDSPTAELRRRLHENASSSSDEASSPPAARRTQAEILQEHRNSLATKQQPRQIESSVLPSLPPRQMETQEDPEDIAMRNAEPPNWGRSRFSNGRDINSEFIRSQREIDDAPPLPTMGPPTVPARAPMLPERGPNIPERNPTIPERDKSVSSLVNSYQQRMRTDTNGNRASERQNNNWQNVETTSQFYSSEIAAYGGAGGGTRPASVAGSGGSPALDQRPASRSSGESELSLSGNPKDKKDKKGVFGGLFSRKKRPQSHM